MARHVAGLPASKSIDAVQCFGHPPREAEDVLGAKKTASSAAADGVRSETPPRAFCRSSTTTPVVPRE
jgi:hypothetical protein